MLLPSGLCSVDRVAQHLGMHRRTLNRHLATEGESVKSIINAVRAELAQEYLANSKRKLYEVADLLGFSSAGAFSRWFRSQFGKTPSDWAAHYRESKARLTSRARSARTSPASQFAKKLSRRTNRFAAFTALRPGPQDRRCRDGSLRQACRTTHRLEATMSATGGTQTRLRKPAPSAPAIVRPSVRRHSIKVELCTPAIGAELSNISLADAASDPDVIAEIRSLWLKHKVLFFRDQDISPMEQQTFAAQFGELEAHPLAPSHPEADKLLMLYRNLDPDKPKNFVEKASRENLWHADVTYKKAPPRGAVLRRELGPETGGDTIWSNMVMAYENLPDAIKQRIDGLYAKHSAEHVFGAQMPIEERHAMAAKNPAAEHPVVLTHPETGEKVLFVNSAFTTHFSNFFNFEDIRYGQDFMPEAHHLMNYLTSQAAIPEYQVRLKWRNNTVAMWDNLQVQHYAVADYGNAPRKMLRATLAGTPLA